MALDRDAIQATVDTVRTNMTTFGTLVKMARARAGTKARQGKRLPLSVALTVAQLKYTDAPTLTRIETGKMIPTPAQLDELLNFIERNQRG